MHHANARVSTNQVVELNSLNFSELCWSEWVRVGWMREVISVAAHNFTIILADHAAKSFTDKNCAYSQEGFQGSADNQVDVFDRSVILFQQINVALWENCDQIVKSFEVGGETTLATGVKESCKTMIAT